MVLTEEEKERIRRNKARALEIKRRRKEEREKDAAAQLKRQNEGGNIQDEPNQKKSKTNPTADNGHVSNKDGQANSIRAEAAKAGMQLTEEEDTVLEPFEVDASPFVTKKEAMKVYCLPEGTMAVCKHVEKENPHRKGWTPMKLYSRAEIRRRARKRFGGLEGLVKERQERERKRFEKDLEKTRDVFR